MVRFIQIVYYNFCLLNYYISKSVVTYLNPFCWIANIKYMNLGFKIWKQQMEKNFQPFLYQLKYDKNLTFFAYRWLSVFGATFCFLITILLQLVVEKSYIIGLILYFIFFVAGFYALDNEKNYEYQEQFVKDKKYRFPLLLMIIWIVMAIMIFVVYSYTASGSK